MLMLCIKRMMQRISYFEILHIKKGFDKMREKGKDFAEKIIEAEIQKEGQLLDEYLQDGICAAARPDVSEECDEDIQELLKKREAYQKELQDEVEAYRKEEEMRKHRRASGIVKAAMLVLVASGCLFAFSMRSEATRMWWLSSVEKIIGSNRGNTVNNDEERIYSELTEEEAAAEIEEKIGVPMPEFQYLPQGMSFDGYDYDENIKQGYMKYLYNDSIVHFYVHTSDGNASYAWIYDEKAGAEKTIDTEYGRVKLFQADEDTERLIAKWEYQNQQYELVGRLSFEEISLILKNILY